MGKLIFYVVTIGLVLLVVSAVLPYWNRYMVTVEMKDAALYGTKHSIEDTRGLLYEKLEDRVPAPDLESLVIEKDENQAVTISLSYPDRISLLGMVLKELEFALEVREDYVKEVM